MKQKLFLAGVVIVSSSFMLPLKNTKIYSDKLFAYIFMTVDPMTGKTKGKLEQLTALYQKPKGKTSSPAVYTVNGVKSPVRLKIAEAVFQMVPDDASITLNHNLYISLYKLTSTRTARTLTITTDGSGDVAILPITITQPDLYTYIISVTVAIFPGEYAFVDKSTTTADGNMRVWTFGID